MEEKELIDWVISKDAREILLVASIVGSTLFLLYGIFNGNPPFFKEAALDEKGRRISLYLGVLFISAFFLTLTLPIIYDVFIDDSIDVYVDDKRVQDGQRFLVVNAEGERVPGEITIKRKGKEKSGPILTLPTEESEVSIYKYPLSFYARRGDMHFEIAKGGDSRIYVADDGGKLWGPIKIRDANGNDISEIPTFNHGSIVVPENARVEFYNAALLYRDSAGKLKKMWVGSKLDFDNWDYGEHTSLLKDWEEPRNIDVLMISNMYAGKQMKSGNTYDPEQLVASSNIFPITTELLISNPLIQSTPISVIVLDASKNGRLVLSSAVFKALQFEPGGKPRADVQVVDYHAKKHKSNE
ncbi:hypothetical protein ACBZ91_06540 [Vibrio natriegens]|uniref:hypothetical protein n=1 Tax=Vibrio natriegens TaxID=691 RepID=UPI00355748B5